MRSRLAAAAVACLLIACWQAADSVTPNDTTVKHKVKPTPPPDPPLQPRLPRARCLTPEGKTRDFEDLVRSECKRPSTPPLPPPKEKVYGSSAPPSGLVITTRPAPGYEDISDCERALTISELQRNIIDDTDQLCVAQILIQTSSVGGIEGGFRIDPDFNFQPNCGKREFDPDVIALKGILLGLLEGVPDNASILDKVVDGVVPSFTPTKEMRKSGNYGDKKFMEVDRDAFAELLGNRTLLLEAFNEDPNKTPPCYKPPPPKYPPPSAYPPASPPSPTYEPRSKSYKPRSKSYDYGKGRRLLSVRRPFEEIVGGLSRRHLQCADCDNADSFPCSYCWQQDVCGDLYWCQDG